MDSAGLVLGFYALSGLTIGASLLVFLSRNLLHAVLFLVLAFLGMAGLFITLSADFIAVANPAHPLKEGDTDVHALFLANYFAQTKALAFGKTADEVRAEGTAEAVVPARVFAGNKPTTSIMAPSLTPSVVGQLIALYEHITFVEGVVWGIDSFDQWGVELGKKLALEIAPAVQGDAEALTRQDSSTQQLVTYYREHRE